jgi:hypothetical protein
VTDCFGHCNEPSDSIIVRTYTDQLSNYQLFYKNFVRLNYYYSCLLPYVSRHCLSCFAGTLQQCLTMEAVSYGDQTATVKLGTQLSNATVSNC